MKLVKEQYYLIELKMNVREKAMLLDALGTYSSDMQNRSDEYQKEYGNRLSDFYYRVRENISEVKQ